MKIKAICQIVLMFFAHLIFSSTLLGQVFIENKGQVLDFNENFRPEVKYYYSNQSASVYFQGDRLVYNFIELENLDKAKYENDRLGYDEALKTQKATYHRMDMVFQNATLNPTFSVGKQTQGVTHYYLNKRDGIRDVKSFETIKYENIYKNIDAVFYHTSNGLKYDLILKQGANIEDIRLKFEGAEVGIEDKKLIIKTSFQDIVEEIPLSFINDDLKNEVNVEYVIHKDGTVGFKLKDNVNYTTLTIDPVLEWGTYFNLASGTGNMDYIVNHLDNDGNYYTFSMTNNSANSYPIVNPGGAYTQTFRTTADTYIMKFDPARQLVWSTYLGGNDYDQLWFDGEMIATHGTTLHLVGQTITTGAPFTNGGGFYQANNARSFWARFNKDTGVLQHLTSLSSSYEPSIAVSNSGLVAIIGSAYSFSNFSIVNRSGAYNQATNGGYVDMALMLFNSSYTQIWGTYLGGPSSQEAFMCTFDNSNNLYFAGETGWLPASTAANERLVQLSGAYYQNVYGGGQDIMLGKFNSSGALVWHTLYGGNEADARRGQQGTGAKILIHPSSGELVLSFNTRSTNLSTQNLS